MLVGDPAGVSGQPHRGSAGEVRLYRVVHVKKIRYFNSMSIYLISNYLLDTLPVMKRDMVDEMLEQWARERPELDASPLSVAVRVQMLGRRFRQDAERSLAHVQLELWEYEVLASLRRQGERRSLSVSRLARLAQLSRGAMTHRIDRLEEKGLVIRRAARNDRRRVLVSLTPAGRRAVDGALEARFRAARSGMSTLTQREQQTLARLMRKLMLTTQEVPPA
jgi:DNA-binding MarR family transcriptional regulator